MGRPRGKKSAPLEPLAILERNLERYPWSRLSDDKGEQAELQLLLDAAGEEGRAWIVVGGTGTRLPGPFDADIYVALCQLYNAAGRPEHRTVRVTFHDLASLMRRGRGGPVYAALEAGLHRLAHVSIRAVQTWREGDTVAAIKTFHLLTAETRHRRAGGEEGTTAVVRFSEDVAESIAAGNFRLLNTAEYFALELPTAKRLYRYLDYRRWRGAERQAAFSISLKQLARELPIDRDAPSHIRRTLDPAHAELLGRGFLASVEYEDRPRPGKRRPDPWVTYQFAEPAALPPPAGETSPGSLNGAGERRDAELRELVAAMLELLQDAHSTAFYVKAAKVLPPDVVWHLIGGVRESIRDGLSLTSARKVFTASVRKRAKLLGAEL